MINVKFMLLSFARARRRESEYGDVYLVKLKVTYKIEL